mgnify:FL=1
MDIIKKGEYMVEKNVIYNEDCFSLMEQMVKENFKVDVVLTQCPP